MATKKNKKKKATSKPLTKNVPKKAAKKAPVKKSAKKAPARKAVARKAPKKAAPPPINPVIHWEIQSQSPARLHEFYAQALGWKIDANNPMNYGMVTSGGSENCINGGIGGSPAPGARVLVYAHVKSIDATLERIASLGGKIVMPRTDIGPVIMGIYLDPEDNTMGLLEGDMKER
jgi:hypothetical protein